MMPVIGLEKKKLLVLRKMYWQRVTSCILVVVELLDLHSTLYILELR